MTSATLPTSHVLAEYIASTSIESIPAEVRRKAAVAILDTVGCMVAGSAARVGRIVTQYAVQRGAAGPCTVFGRAEPVALEPAVLANGTLGHVLELDDGHRPSDNHLGCVVVPAAFATVEHAGASGRDLVRAVVVGYDVMGRVGQAVCLPRLGTAFHHTGTTGGFGSAAAAGAVLGLSREHLASALGIAGTGAAGLREVFVSGTDCKSLQVGRGAFVGVQATLLAEAGLVGPTLIFEGEFGFVGAFTPMPRPELVAHDLGVRYAVMDSGYKVHAACGILFTAIDAAIALRAEHDLDPDTIDKVAVALPQWILEDAVFSRRRPDTVGTSRFSIPFTVAAALREGEITPDQISERGIADPRIAALEAKVELVFDAEVQQIFEATKEDDFFFYPSKVAVEAAGRRHERLERTPRGYDLNRGLTEDEVLRKFLGNCGPVLGAEVAQRVADLLLGVEELDGLDEVSTLLRSAPRQ
jgi:2-methylcitrate dehydratase PrpD